MLENFIFLHLAHFGKLFTNTFGAISHLKFSKGLPGQGGILEEALHILAWAVSTRTVHYQSNQIKLKPHHQKVTLKVKWQKGLKHDFPVTLVLWPLSKVPNKWGFPSEENSPNWNQSSPNGTEVPPNWSNCSPNRTRSKMPWWDTDVKLFWQKCYLSI